jgi:hypothetical protein
MIVIGPCLSRCQVVRAQSTDVNLRVRKKFADFATAMSYHGDLADEEDMRSGLSAQCDFPCDRELESESIGRSRKSKAMQFETRLDDTSER